LRAVFIATEFAYCNSKLFFFINFIIIFWEV